MNDQLGLVYGSMELHAGALPSSRSQRRTSSVRQALQMGRSCQLGPRHLPVEPRIGLRRPHEVSHLLAANVTTGNDGLG